jgi:hypothetical protein
MSTRVRGPQRSVDDFEKRKVSRPRQDSKSIPPIPLSGLNTDSTKVVLPPLTTPITNIGQWRCRSIQSQAQKYTEVSGYRCFVPENISPGTYRIREAGIAQPV